MELSELQKFAGELLAVDDRSGVVYSIENEIVVPRYILVDGNGHSKKVDHNVMELFRCLYFNGFKRFVAVACDSCYNAALFCS